MTFQIHALDPAPFAPLFYMTDEELEAHQARRITAQADFGYPCRVSLEDAKSGETLILVHYDHQPAPTPYRASHGVFMREGAQQAFPAPGEVPQVLSRRVLSVRGFNADHMMIGAEIVQGHDLAEKLNAFFDREEMAYIHLHNAAPGCYAARVTHST